MVIKIQFLCKYNAFRSRAAEGYFKKINKNKNIKVSSAGFIKSNGADKLQKQIIKEILGVEIKGSSRQVDLEELRKQDLVVIVAKDIPKIMFNHKNGYGKAKFIFWNIKDEHLQNRKNIEKIVNKIKTKVEKLVKELSRKS
ncbi:MAG: hypothetical protein OQK82_03410 [Candidatus Pacearchaeota archaeon]|nr:hypothetical protein [Candidatus Pacearchaeota archaeon]